MVSVGNVHIKNCFNLYDDKSLYSNYCKIANSYYKIYNKECKEKKFTSDYQEKLREDVKKWLFNQSLESRMKICTVENELFGKILFHMLIYNDMDKTMQFKPKQNFFANDDEQFEQKTDLNSYKFKNESEISYPSNMDIKVTKTNKDGKKIDAPMVGFSQGKLKYFTNEEISELNFGNYFTFQSTRNNHNLSNSDYNMIKIGNQKQIEIGTEDLFKNIIFFSVHHKNFPDCFTLSPEFLLEKSKFENIFSKLGNEKYFCSLIQSQNIPNSNKKQNQYLFPDWFINKYKEDSEQLFSVAQIAIAFFEQVIMIKYLFNKNDKKVKTFSLLDEQALKSFFNGRKSAINYMKTNYTIENQINLLKKIDIKKLYEIIDNDVHKKKYVEYFMLNRKKVNTEDKFKNNPHIIQIQTITDNPFSNSFEEVYNKKNGIGKKKNSAKTTNSDGQLTLDEIINKLNEILKNNDSINFIDYLLFQKRNCIWTMEYYLQLKIFDELSEIIANQNCKELIYDSKQTKPNKSKHRKKNKKNKNNNIEITKEVKEEEKAINNDIIKSEYDGIFKTEEEELYAPYYLKADTEQKKLFLKLKGNSSKNIINNLELNEKEIIKDYIYNEFILGIIIDNVFLTPLNSGLDFSKELNENYFKYNIKNEHNVKEEIKQNDEKIINEDKKENKNILIEKEKNDDIINIEKEELNNNNMKDEDMNNLNNIKEVNTESTNENNIETTNNNNSKEAEENNKDSLSLGLGTNNFEEDKKTIASDSASNIVDNNDNNNEISIKKEINNTGSDNDSNINNNNIRNNNSNNSSKTKQKKKKEKEQTFFLFDTVKKKKKKNSQNLQNNALISNEFNIITLKESNRRLSFIDKLHNDIIKYETKVITLLNHGMKFKDYCIKEIKRIIQETFNFSKDYNIDVYGSYATGLMIEASDIDIKIKLNCGNKENLENFFHLLCKRLENENKFDTINPIGTASVPVIKLLLSPEKFIKGKEDLEISFKQYRDLSLFKHYLFDTNELTKIKIDVTFIMTNDNNISNNKTNNNIINNESKNEDNNNNNININEAIHDHDKSMGGEMSSVAYVKEQIVKYPEVKFILRVLKRYFYYRKMNTSFLGGLSSYNLFLLLLSYAKFLQISPNPESDIIENIDKNSKTNVNLGEFLFNFLYFFKCLNFKQYVIDINSPNIYNFYDLLIPEKAKEYNYGKSIVIIDPLTGVNASKSSYKIEEIQETFSEAFDFFQNEKIKYDKEGKTKVSKNSNNNKDVLMGLPISNKNDNNHGGGNIIEKFLGK